LAKPAVVQGQERHADCGLFVRREGPRDRSWKDRISGGFRREEATTKQSKRFGLKKQKIGGPKQVTTADPPYLTYRTAAQLAVGRGNTRKLDLDDQNQWWSTSVLSTAIRAGSSI
jgi:hypothetical protein